MSADTYKGESDGKKLARLQLWCETSAALRRPLPEWRVVVLASREGGDLSVLHGMGVPWTNIVAVDRCAEAADACRAKWPSATIVTGNVVDFVHPKTDVVFLDFCAPMGSDTIATSRACMGRMRIGAMLAVAFLKGRENDATLPVGLNRQARRLFESTARRTRDRGAVAILNAVAQTPDLSPRAIIGCLGNARKDGSERFAPLILSPVGSAFLEPRAMIRYQSSSATSRGVPMIIGLFEIVHGGGPRNKTVIKSSTIASGPGALRFHALQTIDRMRNMAGQTEDEALRTVAHLLMVPRSTLAAWKAHATRGTYAKEAP